MSDTAQLYQRVSRQCQFDPITPVVRGADYILNLRRCLYYSFQKWWVEDRSDSHPEVMARAWFPLRPHWYMTPDTNGQETMRGLVNAFVKADDDEVDDYHDVNETDQVFDPTIESGTDASSDHANANNNNDSDMHTVATVPCTTACIHVSDLSSIMTRNGKWQLGPLTVWIQSSNGVCATGTAFWADSFGVWHRVCIRLDHMEGVGTRVQSKENSFTRPDTSSTCGLIVSPGMMHLIGLHVDNLFSNASFTNDKRDSNNACARNGDGIHRDCLLAHWWLKSTTQDEETMVVLVTFTTSAQNLPWDFSADKSRLTKSATHTNIFQSTWRAMTRLYYDGFLLLHSIMKRVSKYEVAMNLNRESRAVSLIYDDDGDGDDGDDANDANDDANDANDDKNNDRIKDKKDKKEGKNITSESHTVFNPLPTGLARIIPIIKDQWDALRYQDESSHTYPVIWVDLQHLMHASLRGANYANNDTPLLQQSYDTCSIRWNDPATSFKPSRWIIMSRYIADSCHFLSSPSSSSTSPALTAEQMWRHVRLDDTITHLHLILNHNDTAQFTQHEYNTLKNILDRLQRRTAQ